MAGKSKMSTAVGLRLPNELLAAIDKRVGAQKCLPESRNEYIVRVLSSEVIRNHNKKKRRCQK